MRYCGYVGRILVIDLTSKSVSFEQLSEDVVTNYIGGRGLGVHLLKPFASLSPFDEKMPLIFASGPITATTSPTSGRMSVVCRSALTKTVFDCSVGGKFAVSMKRAGFDAIVITGKSSNWVNILIDNHKISFEDATSMLNLSPLEIFQARGLYQSTASIGLAGVNLVRYACIIFDGNYSAGRGGLGAVMASKKLKAVFVRGNKEIKVADPQGLKKCREDILRLLHASPAVFGEFGLSEFGTPALVDLIHSRRMEPTANFKKTFFEHSTAYSAFAIKQRYQSKKTGCFGCPILCKKHDANGNALPEYETVSHFGALNECSELDKIILANKLCNHFALDTISTACTISCFAEINSLRLSSDEIISLITQIATRSTDLGRQLAEGSKRYALSQNAGHLSMSVKGLELPAYDPRGAYGLALSYAVSNRGGCHLRAYPISHEILRKPVATDRFSFEGKARIVKIAEDLNAVVDSLVACKFAFFAVGLEEFCNILNAVTGLRHDVQSLLALGERIWQAEREINVLNGFAEADDDLPPRFFNEEGSSTERLKIPPINRDEFLKARANYYKIRGWI